MKQSCAKCERPLAPSEVEAGSGKCAVCMKKAYGFVIRKKEKEIKELENLVKQTKLAYS